MIFSEDHLFHREQTQLFLLATEPLAGYLRHPAALGKMQAKDVPPGKGFSRREPCRKVEQC